MAVTSALASTQALPFLCAGKTLHPGAKPAAARGWGSVLTILTVSNAYFLCFLRCFSPPRLRGGAPGRLPPVQTGSAAQTTRPPRSLRRPPGLRVPAGKEPPALRSQTHRAPSVSPFHHSRAPRRPKAAGFRSEVKPSSCKARCSWLTVR